MLNATIDGPDGKTLLVVGLSFANLDQFRTEAGDTYIKIQGKDLGIPIDVLLFSGETEAHLANLIQEFIGPDTRVNVDPRQRN